MSDHTPGPWAILEFADQINPSVYGPGGTGAVASCGGKYRSRTEKRANARLIAAAPDLLAAAGSFLNPTGHTDACMEVRAIAVSNGQLRDLFEKSGPCTRHCERLRAAIAKATGQPRQI